MTKQELERKLSQSVDGAMIMSAADFGRFIHKHRSTASQKLISAGMEKVSGGYFIPDIAKMMIEGKL